MAQWSVLLRRWAGHVRRRIERTKPARSAPGLPSDHRLIEPAPDLTAAVLGARADAGLIRVDLGGRSLLAYVVDRFRTGEVLGDNAGKVADALENHGVPHLFLEMLTHQRRVLVVEQRHRERALLALADDLGGTATYAGEPRGAQVTEVAAIESWGGRDPVSLRIFRCRATRSGRLLAGPELGCEVQFWEPSLDGRARGGEEVPIGTLIGPRSRRRVVDQLPPDLLTPVMLPVDGKPRATVGLVSSRHLFDVIPEMDAVYTWVDGSDPDWLRAKAAALETEDPGALHAVAANELRFLSREELKYSLRSLDMYADWFRHIFLVTADQVPSWLKVDHPRLTIVSHRELFEDRGRLPTFNSHAIESQLHHIPGLSEHFVYLNDDVFFGRSVPPSTFVLGNGTTRFFLSSLKIAPGPVTVWDRPYGAAAKNCRDLIEARFGRTITNKLQHTPHALRRSVQFDIEREFPDAWARTAATRFRSTSDVSVAAGLGHHYGYATGRALPGRVEYLYADVAMPETEGRLAALLENRDVDVFCLNDNEGGAVDPADQYRILRQFLESYYPLPSPYEV